MKLAVVKMAHTVVWALFAVGILAIPVVALAHYFQLAAWLTAAVLVEVVVLFANRWRCPLSDVAARFTADRADNFDIYLPLVLARYNKQIFGPLFVVGAAIARAAWLHSR